MDISILFSRDSTNAIRGLLALAIVVLHILIGLRISPLFNPYGGLFVAIFLVISGYGINESYRKCELAGYWSKRISKVILPTLVFASVFSLLDANRNIGTWCEEITYQKPTYWFIFHVVKCYAVYWVARRYSGRYWMIMLAVCSIVCLNYRFCDTHLESEQALSFLAGVVISERKTDISRISQKKMRWSMACLFVLGLVLYACKMLPIVHACKYTVIYNYIQCPFRLSWALVALFLSSYVRIGSSRLLKLCGTKSMEIYVAHIPLIELITDWHSVPVFLFLSCISFAMLTYYTSVMQKNLSLSAIAYVTVNAVFVAKYSERVVPALYQYVTMAGILLHYILITKSMPWLLDRSNKYKIYYVVILLLVVVCMVVLQYSMDPYSIKVDRWSALYFPIRNLLNGVYPYIAQTHLGGNASPFPIWQIFHVPFYLLGNVGLSIFFAMAIFVWSVYRCWGVKSMLCVTFLLMWSPALWYEIAVRSDYITNIMLLAAIVNIWVTRISTEWIEKHLWGISIVMALFAGTRLITLIPLAMLLFPYYARLSTSSKVLLPVVFVVVFLMEFLPFALWDWQDFLYHKNNPWILQTRQGYASDFLLFIPLAIYLAIKWKNNVRMYYTFVTVMLIVFIAVSMWHRMTETGNWDIFSSAYDITYYNAALVFAMTGTAVIYNKEDKILYRE